MRSTTRITHTHTHTHTRTHTHARTHTGTRTGTHTGTRINLIGEEGEHVRELHLGDLTLNMQQQKTVLKVVIHINMNFRFAST